MTVTVGVEPVTDDIRAVCRPGDVTPDSVRAIVKRVGGRFYAVLAADDLIAGRLAAEGLSLKGHMHRWSALYLSAEVS